MGIYIDPGNSGFQRIVSSEYVDKTGWKSYAAQMLCAYYDCSCDSRSLFDDKEIAAYMTGILPIKKDGFQSAISDFMEYSILNPGKFAEYTGFTEKDVRNLCTKYGMSFEEAKRWYDGYELSKNGAVYNPYSVMCAVKLQEFQSYWRKTSAAESLMTYINMDFDGMQETILRMISGEEIEVDTDNFENDFETFRSRDDVLTLLIHLGYLTWDRKEKTARIPNEEIKAEFQKILKGRTVNRKWMELIGHSQKLLEDTVAGNAEAVAKAIEEIRDKNYPAVLKDYGGEIVMVGISYHSKAKTHTCKIERN